ncbi:hypothetical protein [Rhizobium sp. ZW T2_16]|uniref:hypothetical protein n=1 Tax=Rhizobium sp. ZW T2_16 TaxID=3378083 RepID=UPI0038534857
MKNTDVLATLLAQTPMKTTNLPRDQRGIYGLIDHDQHLRYIGCTTREAENFRKRIHQRHRTGSETHSHYFSKIYNTGRMYRDRLTQQGDPDAKIAKDFRSAFIEEYCRAVYVPLEASELEIVALEAATIAIAPSENILWNRATTMVYPEPTELVDALIAKLGLSRGGIEALERQSLRFDRTRTGLLAS